MAIKKLHLADLKPQVARGFRYIQVPRELVDNPHFEPLDYGAIMAVGIHCLYACGGILAG